VNNLAAWFWVRVSQVVGVKVSAGTSILSGGSTATEEPSSNTFIIVDLRLQLLSSFFSGLGSQLSPKQMISEHVT
jgi:hypothetical protein